MNISVQQDVEVPHKDDWIGLFLLRSVLMKCASELYCYLYWQRGRVGRFVVETTGLLPFRLVQMEVRVGMKVTYNQGVPSFPAASCFSSFHHRAENWATRKNYLGRKFSF